MIEKIQEKIDKYISMRGVEDIYLSHSASVTKFNLIGDVLADLIELSREVKGEIMIDEIQEKIDKYEVLENEADTFVIQHKIGHFLADLQELLKTAKQKKKACCDKKAAKHIKVTACKNCPYLVANSALFAKYCGHPEEIGERDIINQDIIPDWCPL